MPEVVISIKAYDEASATLRQVAVEASSLREKAAALFRETQGGTKITAEYVNQIREANRESRLQSEVYSTLRRSSIASFGVLNLVADAFSRIAAVGRLTSSILSQVLIANTAQATAAKNLRDAEVDLAKAKENVRIALEKLREAEEKMDPKAMEAARRELKAAYEEEEAAARRLRDAQEAVNNTMVTTQAQILGLIASSLQSIPVLVALAGSWRALLAALGPVGIIITAVSTAVSVLAAAWVGNWGGIRDVFTSAYEAVKGGLLSLASDLKQAAEHVSKFTASAVEGFTSLASSVYSLFKQAADTLAGFVKQTFTTLSSTFSAFKEGVNAVVIFVKQMFSSLAASLSAFFETLLSTASAAFSNVLDALTSALDWFRGVWAAAWVNIHAVGEAVWGKISEAAAVLADVWLKFTAFWGGVWKSIVDVVEGGKKSIADAASFLQGVWSRFIEFWRGVWKAFTEVFEAAAKAVSNAVSWLTSILQPLFNLIQSILAALASLAAQVGGAVGGALSAIGVKIPGYQGLKEPITFAETTLAVLHRGETLLPKGYILGEGKTVNISLTVGPFHVQRLSEEEARRLSEMIFSRLWRLTR